MLPALDLFRPKGRDLQGRGAFLRYGIPIPSGWNCYRVPCFYCLMGRNHQQSIPRVMVGAPRISTNIRLASALPATADGIGMQIVRRTRETAHGNDESRPQAALFLKSLNSDRFSFYGNDDAPAKVPTRIGRRRLAASSLPFLQKRAGLASVKLRRIRNRRPFNDELAVAVAIPARLFLNPSIPGTVARFRRITLRPKSLTGDAPAFSSSRIKTKRLRRTDEAWNSRP